MSTAPDLASTFVDAMPGISPGVYDERDFRAVAAIVYREAGIMLPAGKAMLVYSRLAPLVRASGLGTFAAYIRHVEVDAGERRKTINALTTNHTFFYREAHHFEHFARVARPQLLADLQHGEPVRMWSAGCSSGEEVFSLTMTLLGHDRHEGVQLARRDIRILASDIADHALKKASEGRYGASDGDALPADLRQNWTSTQGKEMVIGPEARSLVQFKRLNLQGEWPMRRPFQVIFCRNVMIYFDQPTKDRLVARLAEALSPGGFLYIGHSERVSGPAEALLEPVGPTIYHRRGR
ncbi:chemotaxis protein methyltransferase CheR [Novosphingobium sp. SG751A]|uniref:CheR family methyltransferase n=1 Tax=Novosphingobium sp. SG751A TaxID=2587000 RepID=UPI001554634A|nr:protein-glutamate O-methyltransferase CheR [Novosphingobium sp. SG751A]NOW47552.1 chemotaxis protein methyltransferase CheR [Novosphingobium sp. SG751A]